MQPYLRTRHFKWELKSKPESVNQITDNRDTSLVVRGADQEAVFSRLSLSLPCGVATGTASGSPEWGDIWVPLTLGWQWSLVATPFPEKAVQRSSRSTSGRMSWGASVGLTWSLQASDSGLSQTLGLLPMAQRDWWGLLLWQPSVQPDSAQLSGPDIL